MTKRILLVEDELTWQKNILDGLKALPCTVETATYMREAVLCLRDNDYDIVISDYMFPAFKEIGWQNEVKGLGIDVLREVRSKDPKLPFILHTSSIDDNVIKAVERLGGTYHKKDSGMSVSSLIALVKEKLAL